MTAKVERTNQSVLPRTTSAKVPWRLGDGLTEGGASENTGQLTKEMQLATIAVRPYIFARPPCVSVP